MFLWAQAGRLNTDAQAVIADSEEAYVSAATIWEIEIKRASGKLRAEADFIRVVDEAGLDRLPISFDHAVEAGRLPLYHLDPFDRMLVAQARLEGLTFATGDESIARYDVPLLPVTARSA